MKQKFLIKVLFLSALVLGIFVCPSLSFAKTDLSISDTDIIFSKDNLISGQAVRIYARIFNNGDTDVYGFVMFFGNDKELGQPQPISVRANNYDDVFIDWQAVVGTYNIQAKIINTNPTDENLSNNVVTKKNIFVDVDANKNGVGDKQDQQNSVSGLANQTDSNNLNLIDNAVGSIKGVLGIKDANLTNSQGQENNASNKNDWLLKLQNYLDSASRSVKNNKDYNKYFLPGLVILFITLILLFRKRR
jgi:hypothetical protein